MEVIRERALQFKEGTMTSKGEAILPLMLASFIFESLVLNNLSANGARRAAPGGGGATFTATCTASNAASGKCGAIQRIT